ncbi:Nif3-like dinuclear metal center hexameric protein [Cloacibacillus sp. An23]|uniref:Nif3-like dinuclear metal center hexameric protein n=1 Tax=Cloacibacillus sp. An23 TaxID=1965591 RepID=UPI000B37417F|nr:Nif3-like dinuclear metal center hexameric protein [Cloacibacillus sp. An23]OUO94881.1 Nif3-like dinuclear metal center hexameric protein [Cloacibacillus sp. An23]
MKLSDIIEAIEKRAPKEWAEPWDNPGLQAGERGAEVRRIAVALDASPRAVARAAELGCGLLLTHHPIIFRPVKSVTDDCHVGKTLLAAVKNGVALYAAHTNWDSSPEGVNFVLASQLGLKNIKPLIPSQSGAWGLGAAGDLPRGVHFGALGELLRERWNLTELSLYGDLNGCVRRVALGGGACMDFWPEALALGAQCFITSDVTYHPREEAAESGLYVAACDHGEMERVSLPALAAIAAGQTGLPVTIIDGGAEASEAGLGGK